MRRGHGGLPAFRRLIAKQILKKVHLQDVVFAHRHPECTSSKAAATRASLSRVSILGKIAVKLEKLDLIAVREGLLKMVEAGAAPELEALLPEYGPMPLLGLSECPSCFGMQSRGQQQPAMCQLQSIQPYDNMQTSVRRVLFSSPVPTCSLQNVTPSETWSEQTVAILGLLFFEIWQQATTLEASKQPERFKPKALSKMLSKHWAPCGVKLVDDKYVIHICNRYEFDGGSLLKIVTKFRADTKIMS